VRSRLATWFYPQTSGLYNHKGDARLIASCIPPELVVDPAFNTTIAIFMYTLPARQKGLPVLGVLLAFGMAMTQSTIGLAAVVIAIAGLYRLLQVGGRPPGIPPGPPTIPILGNLHLMPSKDGHHQFSKWAQEYGPIYSLILGTRTFIVLSSDTAVKDLLDKRSNIYSSRPDMYVGMDIASGSLRMLLMPYSGRWRLIHKMIHNILNIKAAVTYVPYQDLENKFMLLGMLEQPLEFANHIRRYTNSLTTQMVFGFRTLSIDDPKLQQLFTGFEHWAEVAGNAASQLLDLFPVLQRLPDFLVPNHRYAKRLHKKEKDLYVGHWLKAKAGIQNGTTMPCFCVDLVNAQQKEKDWFSDDLAGYTSGSLLEAGSDTTASELIAFIQAMTVFQDVQRQVQDEIDRVVGSNRMPNMEDYANLPLVRGCVKETLRWMPTNILGVPHSNIQEDDYMGYRIPKASTIITNVW
jgi:cytochrome P450